MGACPQRPGPLLLTGCRGQVRGQEWGRWQEACPPHSKAKVQAAKVIPAGTSLPACPSNDFSCSTHTDSASKLLSR